MSIEKQKVDFANMVLNHPALDAVREEVQFKLFNKFRTASPDEREQINHIMDNEALFFNQLEAIRDDARMISETDNEK